MDKKAVELESDVVWKHFDSAPADVVAPCPPGCEGVKNKVTPLLT